jgi:hypothetical protein
MKRRLPLSQAAIKRTINGVASAGVAVGCVEVDLINHKIRIYEAGAVPKTPATAFDAWKLQNAR